MATTEPRFTGKLAVGMRRTITAAVFVVSGLVFAFGFGNAWTLGLRLGVPGWVAPLVPDGPAVPDQSVLSPPAALPAELVARARQLDAEHRAATGRGITRDQLRAKLQVSNARAGHLLRHIRDPTKDE
jgi:hypothetical protein